MTRSPEDIAAAKQKNEARLKLYNEVVDQANLRKLLLSDVSFKINREMDVSSEKPRKAIDGRMVSFSKDPESNAIAATIEWSITMKVGRKLYAKCIAVYHVIYDGFSIEDEEILELFAFNVGRPATYTYFRSLFATLDWAAELRLPPLPVMKFFPKV